MKIKRILALFIIACILSVSHSSYAAIDAGETDARANYVWDRVKIGGGGLISGLIFHPLEKDLIYARTDVGGAYRWDVAQDCWIPIADDFSRQEENLYGVEGFAVDPYNTDIIYAALGKYWWLAGGLYKSDDRGDSWKLLKSARVSGNMPNRQRGESVCVDPNNSKIIYFGTRGEGLLRSGDGGETWETATGIEYLNDNYSQGVRNVVVDKTSGENGGASQTVYAGSYGKGVYISRDGGKAFEHMEGSPQHPFRMSVNKNGVLYVTDDAGVYKYENGAWTDISPVPGKPYQALDIGNENPDYIVVAGNLGDVMKMPVFTSYDAGKTWRNTFESVEWTEQAEYIEDDNFSSNTVSLGIDPYDEKRILITDWHGIFETFDITEQPTVHWTQKVLGIEEMCSYMAACPPEGDVYIHLAVRDCNGFPITDITKLQPRKFEDRHRTYGSSRAMTTTDVVFCENDPNFVARIGHTHSDHPGGYSLDGGMTWSDFETSPFESSGGDGGEMAMSSDINADTGFPTIIFYQVGCNVKLSRDMGKTWELLPFENITDGRLEAGSNIIASDKVNPNKFYIYEDNFINISDDGGKSWRKGAAIEGKADGYILNIKAAPGRENELWVSPGGKELYRSTDGGETFSAISGVSEVVVFGFGMPIGDSEYPTLFVYGSVSEKEGIYRSTDAGKSWIRIDVDTCVIGNIPSFVEGDRQHEGVVYIGTDGSGVYYGAPEGTVFKNTDAKTEDVQEAAVTKVSANGKAMAQENIRIKDDAVYVALRPFFEALNAEVIWDEHSGTVSVAKKEFSVNIGTVTSTGHSVENQMVIDFDKNVRMNDKNYDLKYEIFVVNDMNFISLEDASAIWNLTYKYNEADDIYKVYDKSILMYE